MLLIPIEIPILLRPYHIPATSFPKVSVSFLSQTYRIFLPRTHLRTPFLTPLDSPRIQSVARSALFPKPLTTSFSNRDKDRTYLCCPLISTANIKLPSLLAFNRSLSSNFFLSSVTATNILQDGRCCSRYSPRRHKRRQLLGVGCMFLFGVDLKHRSVDYPHSSQKLGSSHFGYSQRNFALLDLFESPYLAQRQSGSMVERAWPLRPRSGHQNPLVHVVGECHLPPCDGLSQSRQCRQSSTFRKQSTATQTNLF